MNGHTNSVPNWFDDLFTHLGVCMYCVPDQVQSQYQISYDKTQNILPIANQFYIDCKIIHLSYFKTVDMVMAIVASPFLLPEICTITHLDLRQE